MAGRKKGGPKTGGRKAGTRNKRTAAQIKAVEDSGITPLDYMLSILRDEEKPESVRLQAAKDSAPYVHQRLQAIALDTGDFKKRNADQLSDKELEEVIAAARVRKESTDNPKDDTVTH